MADMVASWVRTRGPRCTYPLIVKRRNGDHVAEVLATMHAMETAEVVLCRPLSGAVFIDPDARRATRLILTVHPITGAVRDLETCRDHDTGVQAYVTRVSAALVGVRLVPGNPVTRDQTWNTHTDRW